MASIKGTIKRLVSDKGFGFVQLAGLAGVVEVIGVQHRLLEGITSVYGFSGIVAALFGSLYPLGTIPASYLFGSLLVGADKMQRAMQVPSSLVDVLLGLVVLRHFTAPLRKLQQMALHLAARFRGTSSQPLSDNGVHLREWESFRGDDELMDLHRALRQFSDELAQSLQTQRDVIKSWEDTFDAVPDMILILDHEERIVRCNRALSQVLNLQCREIVAGIVTTWFWTTTCRWSFAHHR